VGNACQLQSYKIICCGLFVSFLITSSTLFAQDDAIRKIIVDGAAAGGKPNVYLNVLGKLTRVQLIGADEKGVSISFMDNPLPIAWKELPPEHLGSIAGEYAKTGNDFLTLVQFFAANNLAAQAEKAALSAMDKDKSLATEVGVALNRIKKPEAPPPAAPASPATPPADPTNSTTASPTGFPTSSSNSSGSRQNHEGRTLPAMPDFKQPYWFDTPEADAICAAMQVFPKDNAWNEDISRRPVHPDSAKMIANIGENKHIRIDWSMNFIVVPPDQAKVDVKIAPYSKESDPGPYPVPANAPIEGWMFWGKNKSTLDDLQRNGDGDRHCLIVDPVRGFLYEFYIMRKTDAGWIASGEATFNLNSNKLRPKFWTSADAAGLSIFAGCIRHDEVERGMVEHAIRLTVSKTRKEFIYPATHYASAVTDPTVPAMGQRLRLKASTDLTGLPKDALAIGLALKKYGLIVADNGSDWDICATSDKRWNTESLKLLQRIKGSDFEVIVTSGEHEPPRSGAQ
jgi:hypothetical protein